MNRHWITIVGLSVVTGLILGYLRDPEGCKALLHRQAWRETHPFVAIDPSHRLPLYMPHGEGFSGIALEKRVYGLHHELGLFLSTVNILNSAGGLVVDLEIRNPPAALSALLASLPPAIQSALSRRLEGVYLGANLGTRSLTDYLFRGETDPEPYAAFIALDLREIHKPDGGLLTLAEWLVARERDFAGLKKDENLEAIVENNPGSTAAVELGLLRELGIVLAMGTNAFPPSYLPLKKGDDLSRYPFTALSWRRTEKGLSPRPASEAPPLPTFAGTTSPIADFADSFATYVHTVVFGQPFELRVVRKGKVVRRIEACWTQPRCAAKRAVLEDVIRQAGTVR